jgi:hypothetical protein
MVLSLLLPPEPLDPLDPLLLPPLLLPPPIENAGVESANAAMQPPTRMEAIRTVAIVMGYLLRK